MMFLLNAGLILRLMPFTVPAVFAVCASARILGADRIDLFFDDPAYLADHLQCAPADFVVEIYLHVNPVLAVMDESPADDGLKVLLHQKSIGGKLVLVVQVNASIVGETELVVHRHEFSFGLHQIVQNSSQAQDTALQSYPEQFLCLVQLRVVEDGPFAAFLSSGDRIVFLFACL
jgi:hypothetical protein